MILVNLLLPDVGLFFWTVLAFGILFFVLTKYAWKPILKMVNDREQQIVEAISEAEKAREEMALLKADNERILKEAKIEREAILKEARAMKDNMVNDAKNQAKAEAAKILENTKNAIQNEKMAAMTDLKNQVAKLSLEMAEKVLGKELEDKGKQENLVQELIGKVTLN